MQFLSIYTNQIINKLKQANKIEWFFAILVFSIIIYSHAHNMFLFPYYENDEGTYMSQAWAVSNLNKLAPYTYWYDHSPLGWMILALLTNLIGGYNAFGTAINTGRVIMFAMHMVSTVMIIATTKKLTNNIYFGLIAALLFSLFPLGNLFQRRVLLDNIMICFFSISLYFTVDKNLTLKNLIYSSVFLGISILSKESAIFFVPAFLYLIYTGLSPKRRVFGIISWIGTLASIVLLYPFLAILKTELLPSVDKVSLLGTLAYQASRGRGLPFWAKNSDFMISFEAWLLVDKISIFGLGLVLAISTLLILTKYSNDRFVGIYLLCIFYILFLIRGKTVLEFYIVPIFYLFAILGGMILSYINFRINKRYFFNVASTVVIIIMMSTLQFKINSSALYKDEVTPYMELTNWIRKNLPEEAKISIDCGVFMDLQFPQGSDKVFKNADWYWKNDYDPDIRVKKLGNNPLNIEYIYETFQYLSDLDSGATPFNKIAYYESKKIKDFSKNGITANLTQVIKDKIIIVNNSWKEFKTKYISEGAVYDKTKREVTAKTQSIAMLRSLMSNDYYTFDRIWNWTKQYLQKRSEDKLFFSQATIDPINEVVITNNQTSTDADLDIAFALQLAAKKWKIPSYTQEVLLITNDIWNNRIVTLGSNLSVIPFITQRTNGFELINPSHFSPAHYRLFATIDPDKSHKWTDLAFESYKILESIVDNNKIIPNWIIYNYKTNTWESASKIMGPTSDYFGYESSKLFWRLNLDKQVFYAPNSESLTKTILPFFENEFMTKGMIASTYDKNYNVIDNYETTANDAGIYSLFALSNSYIKPNYWKEKFITRVDIPTMTLDTGNNLNNQNYGALIFGTKEGFLEVIYK